MTRKIVVADDEQDYRKLVRIALKPFDFEITESDTGPMTLEKVREINPDLLLLDINMPGMDGYAVCDKIRKDPVFRRLPIIMLTVRKTPPSQARGLETGADYMLKGVLNSIIDEEKGEKIVYYQADLNLINLENNSIIWAGQKKIKKYIKKPLFKF